MGLSVEICAMQYDGRILLKATFQLSPLHFVTDSCKENENL